MPDRCRHGFLLGLGYCHSCEPSGPTRPKVCAPPANVSRGDARRFAHPGFQDLTGRSLAGCLVLDRAPNVSGNARWRVRAACGHVLVVEGIALRAAEKAGRMVRCPPCRARRPGTVTRRTRRTG